MPFQYVRSSFFLLLMPPELAAKCLILRRQDLFKPHPAKLFKQGADGWVKGLLPGQLRDDSALGSVVRVDKFSVVAVLRFNVEFYRFAHRFWFVFGG